MKRLTITVELCSKSWLPDGSPEPIGITVSTHRLLRRAIASRDKENRRWGGFGRRAHIFINGKFADLATDGVEYHAVAEGVVR